MFQLTHLTGFNAFDSGGGPSVVSTVFAGINNGTAVNPVDFTTTGAIAVGNLLVVMFELESNAGTSAPWASSVTINGTGLTRVTSANMSGSSGAEMWYLENSAAIASGVTLRITPNTSTFFKIACVAATATNILTSGSLDKSATATGTSTSPTATTASLTQANELCFGGIGMRSASTSYTEASGWTTISQQVTNTTNAVGFAYQEVSSTAAVTYAATLGSGSTQWGDLVATFKKA